MIVAEEEMNEYLGDMSQPCCMNAAKANQRLLMILKSFAMLEVGMWGDPCDPCGCCSVGSFLVPIVGSPPVLRVSTLHSYGENLWRTCDINDESFMCYVCVFEDIRLGFNILYVE